MAELPFSQDEYRQLEDLMDRKSVSSVLKAITDICYEKEEHVESNWQDSRLAAKWKRAAKKIYSVASSAVVKDLP